MLLQNVIRRRLLSLLQPWLLEEPEFELELNLGLIKSLAVVNNLRFDVSVLNQLFDKPAGLFLKEVTVEHLSFRFSGWYTPAFTIEVHGVRVVQSFVKPDEEIYHSRLRTSKYDYSENLTKNLWGLDPEGCGLHGLLERILFSMPSRKNFTTSLSNLILKHCHLEVHNIHVEVHFPILNDMFMCFGEIKELSARPEYLCHRCLLVGLLGSIFRQLRESSCTIDGIGIKVGFKKGDHGDCIFLSSDLYILIKLSDLKLADCSLYFPKLIFSFSPDDISLYLAFDKLLHNKYNHARSARELWKIAASRISHVTVNPRLALHKVVGIISQWVQYVNAYQNLLLIVGYSSDHLLKRSISKMSRNKLILSSARSQWDMIADIEKKLPIESVALGRRIARHRAALKVQSDGYKEYLNSSHFNFFRYFLPILALISVIWKVTSKVIHSVANILFLRKRLVQDPDIDEAFGSVFKHPWQRCCFILNFGKITITVSPINEIQSSAQEKLQSHKGIGQSAFISFCLFIDALLFVSVEDIFEQKYFLSCGHMKVKLSPSKVSPETRTTNLLNSDGGQWEEGINEIETILWIEPAKVFLLSESNATCAEGSCDYHLEKFLGKICLSWKGICKNFNEREIEYSENPCFLWEIGRSITYPGFKKPNFSFCECGLMLGKLNLTLACSSLPPVFLLFSQIQHAFWWEDKGVALLASNSSVNRPEISWVTKYECYLKGLIMALLRMLPEKCIQFGVFIDGPCVRFLRGNETSPYGQDINDIVQNHNSFDLTFDFHDIEAAAGSPSLFGMGPLTGPLGFDKAESEYIRLEPQPIKIPKPNNEEYTSWGNISFGSYLRLNGLSACLGKSTENGQIQLFQSKPITVHLTSFREYIYSLSTTMVAFSAAVDITMGGLTVLAFLDEMYIIYQAISSLYSVVSYLYSSIEAIDWVHQEIMNQEVLFAIIESVEATVGETLLTNNICPFSINGTCRLKSVDLILHKSRKSERVFGFLTSDKLAEQRLPDCGIWITLEQTTIVISCEEGKMDLFVDLSRIMFLIFKYQNPIGQSNERIILEDLLLESVNCLHEISLSSCIFNLYWRLPWNASSPENEYKRLGISNSGGNVSNLVRDSILTTSSERSNDESHSFVKEIGSTTDILASASTSCLLSMTVKVGMVYIGRISVKDDLVRAHQLNNLLSLLSIGGQFQMISWETQGGVIVLEATSLPMASDCYSSYLHCVGSLTSDTQQPNKHIVKTESTEMRYNLTEENDQDTLCTSQQAQRGLPDNFAFSLSRFSLVCVLENEPGGIRELVLEVDIHLKFDLATSGRKLTFDLSHLSIISQVLRESVEDETQIPHFSSVISKYSPSHFASGDRRSEFKNFIEFNSIDDASTSRGIPLKRYYKDSSVTEIFHFNHQNDVLKDLKASLSLMRPDSGSLLLSEGWCGIGSLSGLDMTLSLSEMQAILSTASSFSGVSNQKATGEVDGTHCSTNQELDNKFEAMIPNGAIVAIRDVSQHMYFTVEDEEKNFSVGGTIHYSLVGERALFRVKHCFQRRWNSTVLWFSLISLYAKNDKGVPLRLNYSPGSCLIDISCTNDGGSALWRVHPCDGESSKGVTDWEGYNQFAKRTFYLVNKKNDSAVAFVDGVPEFVSKPGNPFKFKVLHDLSNFSDVTDPTSNLIMAPPTSLPMDEDRISWLDGKICHIDFKIEKISLNIVHELSDAEDFFPLISGNINNTKLIIQRLATKYMVISTSTAVVHYFHAPRNLWEELLHPVEICFFYRSNFRTRSSEYTSNAVPVNIYFRTKELDISLSELSLDVLLFVIGKLNLSGPYSLRSSMVLANCCKVENQSGLNLLIHFNQQKLTIARKQSTSILLRRHYDFTKQDSEVANHISIQLADVGSFATSSIHLSLLEAQAAWRTRIMSNEASRTYPGPYLVINISRKTEDGLSVVVSPLIRIHNETGFLLELQFQRPQAKEDEFASVSLKPGDSIDDSMAMFDAMKFSGGVKRALMSLSLGNFLLSFRPVMTKDLRNSKSSLSAEWSDYIKGGKSVRLSGIFDKLNYRVRKALLVKSDKCSFSTAHCILKSEDAPVANMHFLIQTISRDVPVATPDKSGVMFTNENAPVSLQEQKEIYLLPTVQMTNLLHSEIDVLLGETDTFNPIGYGSIGKQAKISSGSTVHFYANPAVIYFIVTLTASNLSSQPVNSGDCVKKLLKQKNDARNLDINLDFGGGKFFAILRLYRGNRGILEAVVFTSYAIKNDTEFPVYVLASKRRPLSRSELDNLNSSIPLELGLWLPPKSTRSWFLKSKKVQLKLLEDHSSDTLLDLDTLSGLTELSFGKEDGCGIKSVIKLGLSIGPSSGEIAVPSQTVTLVPRYVIFNESEECITVRQFYLQDDMEGTISINSKQQTTLQLKGGFSKKREFSLFEHFIRKHRSSSDNSLLYIQIQTNEPGLGWSGPVCIASLGRFFLKFRKQTNQDTVPDGNMAKFAAVHVVEEGSTLVLHFYKPPNMSLPYRIENCLHGLSITYYQKDSLEPEVLGSACSADYVWDDITLPHRLVVRINDSLQLREINLDKVRSWKPFYKLRQQTVFAPHLLSDKRSGDQKANSSDPREEMAKVGYEIYAEGPTRVLRICERFDSFKRDTVLDWCAKIQIRVSQFAVHLLEHVKQEEDENEPTDSTQIVVARVENLNFSTVSSNQQKYNAISVQHLNLELKWNGAPFASMLRRQQLDYSDSNDSVLKIVFILPMSSSNVKQVSYSSIFLQPIVLNLDEETLMKIVSFWRTSLSDSESQRYYFDHFEIHPIKITANFIPGESQSSYSSAQETLRSLLHSVVKVPPIKNMVVELNGVLITHALITVRELFIRCAQHYSWYAMRAIYIAKGSPLLPPDFVSIFDDLASSSLDVFFDPSHGSINLPGFTLGTFKFISKCIQGEGFSGTKRYFGDLGKTLRSAGSNVAFAAVAEISDSVLKGAEASGFNGMMSGFHQGILKLAMEPSFLGTALMEGGPDRKITLDRSPGIDELYIEGYIQAMLDTIYRQEYLRVRVIDNQVILKNLPPNHSLINEIMDRVKEFLVSKALIKGDPSTSSRPLRHLRGESEWKIGPTMLTLCEHLFVGFAIRMLRRQANKFIGNIKWKRGSGDGNEVVDSGHSKEQKFKIIWKWGIGKFVFSGILAYIDGRLCRCIPNPVARRVVSGFLLSYIDQNDDK